MTPIDALAILAFLAYSAFSGFRSRRIASRGLDEYFLAGRTLSKGTAALLDTPPLLATADTWIKFLVALDAIFLTVAFWAFEPLCEEA